MRSLFDVSLLIAMFQPDHARHLDAQAWWSANSEHGWASCALTQNGFVRIVSQPRYPRPMTVTAAIDRISEQVAATDHAFWSDDISLLDETRFDRARMLGPKQLTDIYLLALAVRNGGRLATLDRTIPLAAVRGAEPDHLAVI